MSDGKISFKTRPVRIEEPTYQAMAEMAEKRGVPLKILISQMFDEWHQVAKVEDNQVMDEVRSLAEQMLNIKRKLQLLVNGRLTKAEPVKEPIAAPAVGLEKYFG